MAQSGSRRRTTCRLPGISIAGTTSANGNSNSVAFVSLIVVGTNSHVASNSNAPNRNRPRKYIVTMPAITPTMYMLRLLEVVNVPRTGSPVCMAFAYSTKRW
jgi:hypothetical protein